MNKITYTVEVEDGYKEWFLNGKLHREDGPAVEDSNGHKSWYINGNLHREDGPAIEWSNGYKLWYINGVKYTESEFKAKTQTSKNITVAELEKLLGYKIKIISKT